MVRLALKIERVADRLEAKAKLKAKVVGGSWQQYEYRVRGRYGLRALAKAVNRNRFKQARAILQIADEGFRRALPSGAAKAIVDKEILERMNQK
jgi:hypothetical protein